MTPNVPNLGGWVCVPMVAESYGAWGEEASAIISSIASRLATSTCKPKSVVLNDIYGRLNVNLVRANATAILSRMAPPPGHSVARVFVLYIIS